MEKYTDFFKYMQFNSLYLSKSYLKILGRSDY